MSYYMLFLIKINDVFFKEGFMFLKMSLISSLLKDMYILISVLAFKLLQYHVRLCLENFIASMREISGKYKWDIIMKIFLTILIGVSDHTVRTVAWHHAFSCHSTFASILTSDQDTDFLSTYFSFFPSLRAIYLWKPYLISSKRSYSISLGFENIAFFL